MTVTTYQEYVPPTQVPTEGKGAVYLRFENLPKGEAGPTLGPYPCVTLSLDSIQVAPDYVEIARSRDNLWSLSKDNRREPEGRPEGLPKSGGTVGVGGRRSARPRQSSGFCAGKISNRSRASWVSPQPSPAGGISSWPGAKRT